MRPLTKREVERLLAGVDAAGDDIEAVRRVVGEAVAALLARASIEELWDLTTRLNERRML